MSFSIEKHPDLPAIVITQTGSQFLQEFKAAQTQLVALLDEQDEPVSLIYDARGLSMSIDDLTAASIIAPRGARGWAQHSNTRDYLVVTTDELLRLVAQGFQKEADRQRPVRVYETLDQALDACGERAEQAAA